jgi:hypothetical protein
VTQTKIVAVDCLKTNPDKDYFIVMPKNALPKGYVKGKAKDTYGPAEIEVIPKISMFRYIKLKYYFRAKFSQETVEFMSLRLNLHYSRQSKNI